MGEGEGEVGALVDGRYRLERTIGEGGMAVVWKALDINLDQRRALKIIRGGGRAAGVRVRRLGAEGRALSRLENLRHPNLVRVFEFKEFDDPVTGEPRAYIVMELVEGGNVDDQLGATGTIPARRAVRWMMQVLSALGAAHQAGVVHRDVKPSNILLDREGNAVLADFGIALLVDDDKRFTRTGVMMGSVAFAAPEQRLSARRAVPASDLYSAGAALYQMLTGQGPDHLFADSPDEPRWLLIPAPLRTVLVRAMRKLPEDRYATAHEFSDALAAALEQLPDDGSDEGMLAPSWAAGSDTDTPLATLDHTVTADDAPVATPVVRSRSHLGVIVALLLAVGILGGTIGWRAMTSTPHATHTPAVVHRSDAPPVASTPVVAVAPVAPVAAPLVSSPVVAAAAHPVAHASPVHAAQSATLPVAGRWGQNAGTTCATLLDLGGAPTALAGTWKRRSGDSVRSDKLDGGDFDLATHKLTLRYQDDGVPIALDLDLGSDGMLAGNCYVGTDRKPGSVRYARLP